MKKKISYTDEPMGELRVIKDFLPPPEKLVLRENSAKITMFVSQKSLDFFKKQASKYKIPYQKMIRRILDLYVERHEKG